MYKVGITGGIGSGKSTVSRILAECGVAVYTSDDRAKELMTSSQELSDKIVDLFGEAAYLDGKLNSIVHPAVMDDFDRWAEEQEGNYVVLESAILFEANLDSRVDCVVSVLAPEELRIERAMQRDGASREDIVRRIANQISDDERTERSKYAIVNISLENLHEDVEQLHRRLSYDSTPRNY